MSGEQLLSIIVPAYNIAPYVIISVRSILQQTYSNIEVILVDDGSTDKTLEVLEELKKEDSRVRVIHQENSGVTRARLAGVSVAQGEWVGFVDGDDIVEPDMYERLLLNTDRYSADISHCGYQMVFPSRVDYYYNTGNLVLQDSFTGLKDLIEGSFIEPSLCNKIFRKRLFNRLLHTDLTDYSIKYTEDLLINFFLFQEAEQSVYEDFCSYHYMIREGSATTSNINENKLRDPLKVLTIIKKQTMNNPELQIAVNTRIVGYLISLTTMKTSGMTDKQSLLVQRYRREARENLKEMIPILLRGNYSKRTKLLSCWALMSPHSYSFAHKVYSHYRGTDRKYEVV